MDERQQAILEERQRIARDLARLGDPGAVRQRCTPRRRRACWRRAALYALREGLASLDDEGAAK